MHGRGHNRWGDANRITTHQSLAVLLILFVVEKQNSFQ